MFIDTSFPAGNVQILKIEGDHIHFGPDNRDNKLGWFHWCFRINQAGGRTLHFHPCRKNLLTHHAPAVSIDAGRSWSWADRACMGQDDAFTLTIPPGVNDFRVGMAIPHTVDDLLAFIDRHANQLAIEPLCLTPRGNQVPLWRIGPSPEQADHRVFIIARHHCCESMASYVVEGLVEAALADDELGQWWRKHVGLTVVPFVDWDGVAAGDQGKNRAPHDHNRDYGDTHIYPQTPAVQTEIHKLAAIGLNAALDMHCPWIHGRRSEEIYMVGLEDPQHWQQQIKLGEHLEKAITGPLPYRVEDNVPFGVDWNTGSNYAQGQSFATWAHHQPGVKMCGAFEIPYALSHDVVMTPANTRQFGRDLAQALRTYLPVQ